MSDWKNFASSGWQRCPPSIIYLALGVISILLSLLSENFKLIGLLCTMLSVARGYYFFEWLCQTQPWLAYVLIGIQLLIIAGMLFVPVAVTQSKLFITLY
jgi:hypothetical protein